MRRTVTTGESGTTCKYSRVRAHVYREQLVSQNTASSATMHIMSPFFRLYTWCSIFQHVTRVRTTNILQNNHSENVIHLLFLWRWWRVCSYCCRWWWPQTPVRSFFLNPNEHGSVFSYSKQRWRSKSSIPHGKISQYRLGCDAVCNAQVISLHSTKQRHLWTNTTVYTLYGDRACLWDDTALKTCQLWPVSKSTGKNKCKASAFISIYKSTELSA